MSERIWVKGNEVVSENEPWGIEYVRAYRYETLETENAALTAKVRTLEEALRKIVREFECAPSVDIACDRMHEIALQALGPVCGTGEEPDVSDGMCVDCGNTATVERGSGLCRRCFDKAKIREETDAS